MKKRFLAVLLSVCLGGMALLIGCSQTADSDKAVGVADNEVLTLTEIPVDKMLITIRGEDGIDSTRLEAAIEAQFPEVDIVMSNNRPLSLDIPADNFQDIVLSSFTSESNEGLEKYLMDLSDQNFTDNYQMAALDALSKDGKLYLLPGPSNIYGIVYNKAMFEQNGWTIPKSQDEFIALCKTIEAAGIRPLQPALYYSDAARQLFAGFNYEALFAGVDNYEWLQKYSQGETGMSGHVEPGFETMSRLMEADALRPEDFDVQPGIRSKALYEDHSCAMILETQMAPSYAQRYGDGSEQSLGMMPFYSGGENTDYLLAVPNYYMAVNKTLEKLEEKDKHDKVLDILEWLSTEAGQEAIMNPEAPMVSSLKDAQIQTSAFYSDINQTIQKGHVVPQPFWTGNMTSEVDTTFKNSFQAWARGEMNLNKLMESCDQARDHVLAKKNTVSEKVIGKAQKDFTVMETSQYFAELFKDEMDADVGLCLANSRSAGNNIQIYKGDIKVEGEKTIDYRIERCFKSNVKENADKQLQKATMTGQQLMDALNHPPEHDAYPDAYYTVAGLKIEFAPWGGDGNRIASVTLADGTAIDPGKTYSVAQWGGSVRPEYITSVDATSEHTAYDIFEEAVQTAGEIAPFDDRRMVLNWDIREDKN